MSEPAVVKFISQDSGKAMFEMGRTLKDILEDTNGRRLGSLRFSSWEEVPLDSIRDHPSFDKAYQCVTDPNKCDVYFLGSYRQ